MTNWMTAAGLALIAGGLATLISFRSFLFGGGERRANRRQVLEAPQRRAALPPAPVVPARPVVEPIVEREPEPVIEAEEPVAEVRPRRRRSRRRMLVSADDPRGGTTYVTRNLSDEDDEDGLGGLASIGFAAEDDEDLEFDLPEAENEPIGPIAPPPPRGRRSRRNRERPADDILFDPPSRRDAEPRFDDFDFADLRPAPAPAPEPEPEPVDEEPPPAPEADDAPRHNDRYGDRVEGWVRPEYQEEIDEPQPGEYWTPIPIGLGPDPEPSAKGYGWPRPVERLPAVPDYEPATGFDLKPVESEPTEVVTVWPMDDDERAGRIRLPESWSSRDDQAPGRPDRRRPRPRPRPEIPAAEPPAERSTVYVSRHAADSPPD